MVSSATDLTCSDFDMADMETTIKVVVLGPPMSGKTTFLQNNNNDVANKGTGLRPVERTSRTIFCERRMKLRDGPVAPVTKVGETEEEVAIEEEEPSDDEFGGFGDHSKPLKGKASLSNVTFMIWDSSGSTFCEPSTCSDGTDSDDEGRRSPGEEDVHNDFVDDSNSCSASKSPTKMSKSQALKSERRKLLNSAGLILAFYRSNSPESFRSMVKGLQRVRNCLAVERKEGVNNESVGVYAPPVLIVEAIADSLPKQTSENADDAKDFFKVDHLRDLLKGLSEECWRKRKGSTTCIYRPPITFELPTPPSATSTDTSRATLEGDIIPVSSLSNGAFSFRDLYKKGENGRINSNRLSLSSQENVTVDGRFFVKGGAGTDNAKTKKASVGGTNIDRVFSVGYEKFQKARNEKKGVGNVVLQDVVHGSVKSKDDGASARKKKRGDRKKKKVKDEQVLEKKVMVFGDGGSVVVKSEPVKRAPQKKVDKEGWGTESLTSEPDSPPSPVDVEPDAEDDVTTKTTRDERNSLDEVKPFDPSDLSSSPPKLSSTPLEPLAVSSPLEKFFDKGVDLTLHVDSEEEAEEVEKDEAEEVDEVTFISHQPNKSSSRVIRKETNVLTPSKRRTGGKKQVDCSIS